MKKRILLFLISLLSIVCFALGFTSCNAPTENSVDPFTDECFLYEATTDGPAPHWQITGLAPGYEDLTEITIPYYYNSSSVVEIAPFAFSGNTTLKKVTISDRLDVIGEYAFYGCTALEEVVMGSSINFINNAAFLDCTSLKTVDFSKTTDCYRILSSAFENTGLEEMELPSSLVYVYENAFYNSKLTKIRIPASVELIEDNAFYTETLQETHIESLKSFSAIEFSSEKANPSYYTKNLFLNGKEIKSLVLPDDCYLVKDFAFTSLTLDGIHIGSNTLTIYEGAFAFATRLGEITVSEKNPNYEAIDNCLIQKKNPESKTLVTTTQSTTEQTGDTTTQSTTSTTVAAETNQIPAEHQNAITAFRYTSEQTQETLTVTVAVGGYVTPPLAMTWENATFYSENTAIAIGEGMLVKGVSPGTTYLLIESEYGTTLVYRVIVQ